MTGRRAFTLVEMLVVMGVLVLLVGVTFAMIAAVGNKAARHQTETTLRLLETAMHEWETEAGRQLSWWNIDYAPELPKGLFEIHADTHPDLIITEMLQTIDRVPSVQKILRQIPDELLYTYEAGVYPEWIIGDAQAQQQQDQLFAGELSVLDGWGYPIYATHPGGAWTPETPFIFPRNRDGTYQTYNELEYGVCRNRTICFVSAGPDRDHGDMHAGHGTLEREKTRDNIFSYTVLEMTEITPP